MQKKLTITVDAAVYEGLKKTIGPRKISKFIEELVTSSTLSRAFLRFPS
jgi:predicted CopG family antitoxin